MALVGYGLAGRFFHAPLIAACEGLELATVVTSDPERQSQVALDHPGAAVVQDTAGLWQAPPHDVVVVATPNSSHADLAHQSIERGSAVVLDKPLAVTHQEAEDVIAAAERGHVLLTVFQNRRWDSDHLTLRRLIDDGRLGEVLRYESRFERWRPSVDPGKWREASAQAGGGQLLDLGSHLVDQSLTLFGPVTHVYAEIAALRGQPADDDAFLALRHRSGTISHLRASALTAAPGPRLRVLGTHGAFVITGLDSQETRLRSGLRPDDNQEPWGVEPTTSWGRLVIGDVEEPVESVPGAWPEFYRRLREALLHGGPPPVDPRDSAEVLRILELARASAEAHVVLAVPERSG